MAARDDGAASGRGARQLREWRGTRSSPSACSSSNGTSSALDRRVERVLGQQRLERRRVGAGTPARRCAGRAQQPVALAGQMATTARRADRRGGDDREVAAHARAAQRDRHAGGSRPATAATSSSARPSSVPPVSPWPRRSKPTAESPAAAAARAKSWWLSLHEPAPWRITTPAHGSPSGSHSE